MTIETNTKYILLVEDNPDDVTLTRIALRRGGILTRMEVACDGAEALDFLFCRGKFIDRDFTEKPAIILLDLNLPRVSGLDVLKQVRADNGTSVIPVIVLTSSEEESDQTETSRLGANDYIHKPTDLSTFVEVLKKIEVNWLLR